MLKSAIKFFVLFIATGLVLSCTKPVAEAKSVKLNISSSIKGSAASYFWIGVESRGEWTLSLEFEGEPWATLRSGSATSCSGTGNDMIGCDYEKNDAEGQRKLTVVLKGKSGKADRFEITQNGTKLPTRPQWIELPQGMEDELVFTTCSFGYPAGSTNKVRNFSLGYLESKRVALWVAYPLCGFYCNRSKPQGDTSWGYGPGVQNSSQPALGLGSYTGSYDRGHQCPAADRYSTLEALQQTYVCTNATPQRSEFNQGFWMNLESRVRSYANKCDTLYVVTGCVMDGTQSTTDKAKNTCPIPGHYYKALLARGKGTGSRGWAAAAFYLDHNKNYSSIEKSIILSISQLEAKLGLDLFPLLKDVVGESMYKTIESENPSNNTFWSL